MSPALIVELGSYRRSKLLLGVMKEEVEQFARKFTAAAKTYLMLREFQARVALATPLSDAEKAELRDIRWEEIAAVKAAARREAARAARAARDAARQECSTSTDPT